MHEPKRYVPIEEIKVWRSFHYALAGIVYCVRTQPNFRIHLIVAALVMMATLLLRLDRLYVIAIVLAIAFVLTLELLNTAIEAIVDLVSPQIHPLAKVAKDAAAGAVFLGTVAAVIVGYLAFYQGIQQGGTRVYDAVAQVPANVVLVMLTVALIASLFAKAWGGGTPRSMIQGGLASSHTALAFAAATGLSLIFQRPLVAVLAFFLALLVAQSRVEARIHTILEAVWGGIIGMLAALLVYILVRSHLVL